MPENDNSSKASSPERQSGEDESSGRRRVLRTLGMSEGERRAREQRRLRFQSRFGSQSKEEDKDTGAAGSSTSQAAAEPGGSAGEPMPIDTDSSTQERKPWETLVIGDVGENLSYIEEKDRRIEQHRYILEHHKKHSPHQVAHHEGILNRLVREREQMADNEENNMPEDQREEKNRIGERLDILSWALETTRCESEAVNIRAAIQGYQSGQIPYSRNFTLIYAGHIVDVCPTYRSFCEDRQERLDRYFAEFGPGWLWQEPPLSGPGFDALAKKGVCLRRLASSRNYHIGHYAVSLRFTANRDKVMRGEVTSHGAAGKGAAPRPENPVSCHFKTLLDCGATFPILPLQDLQYLSIDMDRYPAQGVMRIRTVTTEVSYRFFEMQVSVCSEDGETLVAEDNQAVWPDEPRVLGGFYPVQIDASKKGQTQMHYIDRLSGMVPFEACYMSSAPTMHEFWLGEDRRDVLGVRRMPAHLRFDSEKTLGLKYPEKFEKLRERARTPDQLIFVHNTKGRRKMAFIDADLPDRGKSELAIVERTSTQGGPNSHLTAKIVPKQNVIIEPRRGAYYEAPKHPPLWREDFINLGYGETGSDSQDTSGVGADPQAETVRKKRKLDHEVKSSTKK
ncbi:hypothetical protein AAE478_009704 [Parahypoxylon ruwenzoriense]